MGEEKTETGTGPHPEEVLEGDAEEHYTAYNLGTEESDPPDGAEETYEEDLYASLSRPSSGASLVQFFKNNGIIIAGIGAAVIILLLLYQRIPKAPYAAQNLQKSIEAELEPVKERLAQIETQMADMAGYQEREQDLERLNKRLDRMEANFAKRFDEMGARIAALEKGPTRTAATSSPPKPSTDRYHVVKPKDTLYGIAQRYDISLGELRTLNQFAKDHTIHPGDKIRVRP
jgi:LysM repeat protein